MDLNHLKIAILSQNAVSESIGLNIDDIIKETPDVYVEMTQEDKRFNDKGTIISSEFINNYNLLHSISLLGLTQFSGFNIVMKIYVNKNYKDKITVERDGQIKLNSSESIFASINPITIKGAVYVKLNIPNQKPIMLVNAHLPMLKTKDENGNITDDLGLEFRTKSLLQVLDNIKKNGLDHDTTLVFGGDLNYRITHNGIDQLTELLKHNNPFKDNRKPLLELDMNEADKTFTCKFQEKNPDENCRNTIEPASIDKGDGKNDVASIETNVQQKCGDAKRFPSRCDRFLISESNDAKIGVLVHKGHYFKEIKSDHNTLYAVITYDNPNLVEFISKNGGKKNKSRKSRKNKSKNSKSRKHKTKKN